MHKNVIRSTDKFSDKTLCQPPPPVYSQRGLSGVFLHSTDLNIGVSIPGLKRAIHILKCWVHFFLSASHNNLPKLIPAHWLLLTQLATLVLTLTNTSLSLTKYLLSLDLAIIIFVNFALFVLILTSKLPVPSPLLSIILNLTTATHCIIIFHSLRQKLQNIQNSLARAVTKTLKSSHITFVLKSLHWLKINKRIKYKLLSLTYKVLTTHQPQYLHDLISVQPCHNTRSSSQPLVIQPKYAKTWTLTAAIKGRLKMFK